MLIQERLYIATLCRVYELHKQKIGVNRKERIFVRRLVQTTTYIEIDIYLCQNKVTDICNMFEIGLMTKSEIDMKTTQEARVIVCDLDQT